MRPALRRTFAALEIRNFRLFIFGQGLSMCGTWMQTIGVSWLVLQLTHSGTQLGLVIAAQFLPMLLFGVWGGLIADRFNKRKILYVTQTIAGLLALMLGLLVVTHTIQLWMVYALAFGLGLVMVVDSPTRQSFVIEMVGKKYLKNAVMLNSTLVNTTRIIGPAIAGTLIATAGIGPCFLVNAASYVAVIAALLLMNSSKLETPVAQAKERGQIRAGLRYVWSVPELKSTIIMMLIIGTFTYEFPVVLPLFATFTMHGNASTYSAMMIATGIGAILGGFYSTSRQTISELGLVWAAVLFGTSMIIVSLAPTFASSLVLLVVMGAVSVQFIILGNSTLQISSDPAMRGRVMSLWSIAFMGTTPIGGPVIGYISDHSSPRLGLVTGGVAAILAGMLGYIIYSLAQKNQVSPRQSVQ